MEPRRGIDSEAVLKAEEARIGKTPFCGLAISGGGIRSAAFGLGALQGLVRRGVLERVDYLSTVSGGGYIGSSLTWFLKEGFPEDSPTGTDAETFPFGARFVGARTEQQRNKVLDYIRQHARYLTPGKGLDLISLIGVTLRSVFISLFVYTLLFTVVMYGLRRAGAFAEVTAAPGPVDLNPTLWIAVIILALLVVGALAFSLATRLWPTESGSRYRESIRSQRRIGWLWAGLLVATLVGSLPYAAEAVGSIYQRAVAAGGSTLVGALLGLFEFRKAHDPTAKAGLLSRLRVMVGAAALIYGILLGSFLLACALPSVTWFVAVLAAALVFGIVVNINYVSLHRMYRNRLMETFLPDKEGVEENQWRPAEKADYTLLEEMCSEDRPRPYHLINTNVVLVDSPTTRYKGRGGDSFILSPLFCGSDATGWRPTKAYMKSGMRGMTLATAMAISGAAVNPHTGVAGKGAMRNRAVAALMSLLNLRLGYWAPNPGLDRPMPFPPNFFKPGLWGGVLGQGFDEESRSIELSDGGHFENLGLYELVRRRLPVIIVSDAGADPDFRFGDLANAVERVRVDFGARIRFRPDCGLEGLLPGSAEGILAEKYRLARRGYAVADITYRGEDRPHGTLFYLKSTLTPELPADLYGYKSAHDDFPDQATADQFFDEEQFEAYRELGYQLTKEMVDSEEARELLGSG